MVECIPNVSEGRRRNVVDACGDAIRGAGVNLLDLSLDASHNRSVYTFAGAPDAVARAALALVDTAIAAIDLRTHHGAHPRMGAVDVMPFVPLAGATMAECVALARSVGSDVAARHGIPVFLYEEAATAPARRRLEDIRRGQFEGLAQKLQQQDWTPDFGPAAPHPTAGAIAIGARPPLIAFNVNLATAHLDIAKGIAALVRESSGGLPFVKALGLPLTARGIVQVSMNLTNFERTSIAETFERVKLECMRHAVAIIDTEIVGLVPEAALPEETASYIHLQGTRESRILEYQLRSQKH